VLDTQPEAQRQRSMNQEGAHDIVCGPNYALNLAVLAEVYRQDMRSWTP
jgi:hypothetical protein